MKYVHHLAPPMTTRPSSAELFDLTEALVVRLSADMARGLDFLGLTPARAQLIWELGQRGPCTQRELAGALKVTPRNITGLVDALQDTGFVTRQPHPTDRRAALVTFTEHGAQIAGELQQGHRQLAAALFDDLPESARAGYHRVVGHLLERFAELQQRADEQQTPPHQVPGPATVAADGGSDER